MLLGARYKTVFAQTSRWKASAIGLAPKPKPQLRFLAEWFPQKCEQSQSLE